MDNSSDVDVRVPMSVLEQLENRRQGQLQWLRDDHPEMSEEQKHLDAGTVERAYWHYGYTVALGDVLDLLRRKQH